MANPSSVLFLGTGAKEEKGASMKGTMGGIRWGLLGREMMEASETRRPSVKKMREGEKPRFGPGSVARDGEIKVPSFPAASSWLWPSCLQLFVCVFCISPLETVQ